MEPTGNDVLATLAESLVSQGMSPLDKAAEVK